MLLLKGEPVRAFQKQGPRLGLGVGQEIRLESVLGADHDGLCMPCRVWTPGTVGREGRKIVSCQVVSSGSGSCGN